MNGIVKSMATGAAAGALALAGFAGGLALGTPVQASVNPGGAVVQVVEHDVKVNPGGVLIPAHKRHCRHHRGVIWCPMLPVSR